MNQVNLLCHLEIKNSFELISRNVTPWYVLSVEIDCVIYLFDSYLPTWAVFRASNSEFTCRVIKQIQRDFRCLGLRHSVKRIRMKTCNILHFSEFIFTI